VLFSSTSLLVLYRTWFIGPYKREQIVIQIQIFCYFFVLCSSTFLLGSVVVMGSVMLYSVDKKMITKEFMQTV
jgi:hypothetical protein